MSTILKALKKLERDKQVEAAQSRAHDPLAPAPEPFQSPIADRRRLVWTLGIVAATFCVGVGLGLYSLSGDSPPTVAAAPADELVLAAPARQDFHRMPPLAGVEPADDPGRADRTEALRAAPMRVVVASSESPGVAAPSPLNPAPAPFEVAAADAVPVAPIEAPAAVAPAAAAPSPSPDSEPVADAQSPARPGLADVVVSDADERIEVTVLKTVWHPSAERRSARLSVSSSETPVEVRETDLVEGYVVEEITPSTVVLSKGDVTLTRRVGR